MPGIVAFLIAAASTSQGGWTFCVAEAGQDIWITEVFRSPINRERLEAEFAAMLRSQGATHVDAQCPLPLPDKTEAFNAQFTAAEFHRKLGQILHAIAFAAGSR